MNRGARIAITIAAIIGATSPGRVVAEDELAPAQLRCADRERLRRPFFGDTHVHTGLSFDAWGQGTLARPRDAYRFARGERIGIQPYDAAGVAQAHIQLRRPLDFAVVTDHSDLFGETRICQSPELPGYDALVCRVVRRYPKLGYILVNGHVYSAETPSRYSFCGPDGRMCLEAGRGPWTETQAAAAEFNDASEACAFTTFVGYEWTGMPGGQNIHRNVIFASESAQDYPTTYIETPTQEGLWQALIDECIEGKPDCDAIAIPHNSNVSNGLMWTTTRGDGSPITAADARRRAQLETLVEVTQHKGDSECRAGAEDELCNYETLAYSRMQDMARPDPDASIPPLSYVRETLTEGLVQEQRLGVNPFRFGLIGSTDTHFATPGMVDEDAFVGHAAGTVSARFGVPRYPDRPDFNPGGLAVVWAEENSRAALFAAMKRREVYGTSGPRMTVRFFGGWEFPEELCSDPDWVAKGYAGGVPMGGELAPASRIGEGGAPRLVISALQDPGDASAPGTPLQRIQVVKGWVDGSGNRQERVYDVAGDAGNGASVDPDTCQLRGKGFSQLCRVWRDPEFDSNASAFYYARVVENPSCRWNAWVCNREQVDCSKPSSIPKGLEACCDPELPKSIQERAWTSPIWYTPKRK